MNGTTRTALYVRVARDPEGIGLSVARQREACLALANQLAWAVTETYVDNDRSAYGPRPAYEALLERIRAGELDAVCVTDCARLGRSGADLDAFLAAAAPTRLRVAVPDGPVLDTSTPDGRFVLRALGAMATKKADDRDRRIARSHG